MPDGTTVDYGPAVRRWEAITRPAPEAKISGRLNPELMGWMMGFPAGWCDGIPASAARSCYGNAVVPRVAELFGTQIAPALTEGVAR